MLFLKFAIFIEFKQWLVYWSCVLYKIVILNIIQVDALNKPLPARFVMCYLLCLCINKMCKTIKTLK